MEYKGWIITYNPKPVPPSFGADWDFIKEGADGEDEYLWGFAGSLEEAKYEIDTRIEEGISD